MNDLKFIPLRDIEMIKNYRDVEPVCETDVDVIELSQSLLKLGVLQPVLLRPKKEVSGKYELIFGHRRFMGCKVARLEMVPANIKDVADGDILELQVTENLQRKDVHPMDEAIAFRSLIKDKGYTVEDIAARFGKKPEFVALRLKLNDLVPELQKAFRSNNLSAGQALPICRLMPADQKKVSDSYRFRGEYIFHESSIHDVLETINDDIIRKLSSAPFKKDDATLVTKAGPCTTCQKRSGCGNLLFADMKEDDRCFDATCFESKMNANFMIKLRETIETKPNVHLINPTGGSLPKEIATLLKQMNAEVLSSDKYQSVGYGAYKSQVKGFSLAGHSRGKIENIYVQGAAKKADKKTGVVVRTIADIDQEIQGIKDRQKRALELDEEKVWKALEETIATPKSFKALVFENNITVQEERNAIAAAILLAMERDEYRDAAIKVLGFKPDAFFFLEMHMAKKLKEVTFDQLMHLLRLFMLSGLRSGLSATRSVGPYLLMPILKLPNYIPVTVSGFESIQKEETEKRIARADKRLEALKKEKKELETKAKEKAAKKAAPATAAPSKVPEKKKVGAPKPSKGTPGKNHLGQELTGYCLSGDPEPRPDQEGDDE